MYPFERATVWRVCKVETKESYAPLAAVEPLKTPTKPSAPLKDLNENTVNALTTALATELTR